MKKSILILMMLLACAMAGAKKRPAERFPDGTPFAPWFHRNEAAALPQLGTPFVLTEQGVADDSTAVQTAAIQRVIDRAAECGQAAVVVVPRGTFVSGALRMRAGVNLYLEEGAKLKGSDDIADFPVVTTRIEGQTCRYFSALINADSIDGLRICGRGTIDGNGLRYWKAFWLRRAWNPQCTNKDEQRPRLIYLSHCTDAEVSGLWLKDSPFWTTHLYKCERVKLLNLRITSPAEPVKAPSTDAIDIDACRYIHVRGCYMAVNDDAIALKGGKGPWADQDPANGRNEFILVEDCEYGFCHGCLTCGSEAVHCRNVLLRRIRVGKAARLLWLKMRPDTPQQYEHITVEDITGEVTHFLYVRPWTQFFDLQGRADMPLSYGDHITMRNCTMRCATFFNVERSDQYRLSNFLFDNLDVRAENPGYDAGQVDGFVARRVNVRRE